MSYKLIFSEGIYTLMSILRMGGSETLLSNGIILLINFSGFGYGYPGMEQGSAGIHQGQYHLHVQAHTSKTYTYTSWGAT